MWYRHVLAWRHDTPLAAHGPELARRVTDGYLTTSTLSPAYNRWRAGRGNG
ncbi:hypothetical protein ACGFYU_01650 [Streptomyces sp. NPDC048337]|uniref:hypothetical protein n=1 Tax=Streptomyces sp. NPDC048337 TaxID=3365535 RepID=UPI0037186D37